MSLAIGNFIGIAGGGVSFPIKSLNPIFWIKDTTIINDGYLIDASGNNHQIAAQIVTNGSNLCGILHIQMPANDTAIINALKADGTYYVFYTNDATPKDIELGNIWRDTDIMLSKYCYKDLILLSTPISEDNRSKLYQYWGKPYINIVGKNLNSKYLTNPYTYVNKYYIENTSDNVNWELTNNQTEIVDNTNVWSVDKKTLRFHITPGIFVQYFNNIMDLKVSYGGYSLSEFLYKKDFTLGFWINKSLVTRSFVCYLTVLGGTNTYAANVPETWLDTVRVLGSGNANGVTYLTEVKEVQGDWCYVQCQFKIDIQNWVGIGTTTNNILRYFSIRVAYGAGTMVDQWVEYSDVTLVNDTVDLVRTIKYPSIEDTVNIVALNNKDVCVVGDSISVQFNMYNKLQRLTGIKKIHNCAKSGGQVGGSPSGAWIPTNRATIAGVAADVWILNISANDVLLINGIGTLDDGLHGVTPTVQNNTYYRGYMYLLDYLIANIPNYNTSKIILCTPMWVVGANNTIAQGKTAYNQWFKDLGVAVKEIGSHYGLKVFDFLGNSSPITFENSPIYLKDSVHWNQVVHQLWADKFIKWAKTNL